MEMRVLMSVLKHKEFISLYNKKPYYVFQRCLLKVLWYSWHADWDQIYCRVCLWYGLMNRLWCSQINTNSGVRHSRVCKGSIGSSIKKTEQYNFFLYFDVWFMNGASTYIQVFKKKIENFFDRQLSCNFLSNRYNISHLKVPHQHFGIS